MTGHHAFVVTGEGSVVTVLPCICPRTVAHFDVPAPEAVAR